MESQRGTLLRNSNKESHGIYIPKKLKSQHNDNNDNNSTKQGSLSINFKHFLFRWIEIHKTCKLQNNKLLSLDS